MSSVTETVKETLVGSSEDPQLSHQARFNFIRHAQKDENGEQFMTEDDFINAVAPKQEDYVSIAGPFPRRLHSSCELVADMSLQYSIKSSASSTESFFRSQTDGKPES